MKKWLSPYKIALILLCVGLTVVSFCDCYVTTARAWTDFGPHEPGDVFVQSTSGNGVALLIIGSVIVTLFSRNTVLRVLAMATSALSLVLTVIRAPLFNYMQDILSGFVSSRMDLTGLGWTAVALGAVILLIQIFTVKK